MKETLTATAASIYDMDLPGTPRSQDTREKALTKIQSVFPASEFVGHGTGRFVVWLPGIPHRGLTPEEQTETYDGIVIKFAYNDSQNHDGQRQNQTERDVYQHGTTVLGEQLDREYLTPVFDSGPNDNWLIMPFRKLIEDGQMFEDALLDIFGELITGDIAIKQNWGLGPNNSPECIDYGRLSPNKKRETEIETSV